MGGVALEVVGKSDVGGDGFNGGAQDRLDANAGGGVADFDTEVVFFLLGREIEGVGVLGDGRLEPVLLSVAGLAKGWEFFGAVLQVEGEVEGFSVGYGERFWGFLEVSEGVAVDVGEGKSPALDGVGSCFGGDDEGGDDEA